MVNSNWLTVSERQKKLSRLQRLILKILEENGGSMMLYFLAIEVANKYQIRETEETRRYREEFMRLTEERGLSYLLGREPLHGLFIESAEDDASARLVIVFHQPSHHGSPDEIIAPSTSYQGGNEG